jgi:predicted metal-binding membrane protein
MSGGMRMPGGWTMSMMWMVMPGGTAWSTAAMFLLMWQAMMIAMMLPSTWPILALYRRVALFHESPHATLGTTLAGVGYFAVWLAFAAAAFGAGFGLSNWAMHAARVSALAPRAAALALILAGVYQLTPLKQSCLRHCREPLLYLSHVWKPGLGGALHLGLHHGWFCASCCWALMLIQMLLGLMNLTAMAAIAAVIALEKLWKRGPLLSRWVGVAAITAGIWVFFA